MTAGMSVGREALLRRVAVDDPVVAELLAELSRERARSAALSTLLRRSARRTVEARDITALAHDMEVSAVLARHRESLVRSDSWREGERQAWRSGNVMPVEQLEVSIDELAPQVDDQAAWLEFLRGRLYGFRQARAAHARMVAGVPQQRAGAS